MNKYNELKTLVESLQEDMKKFYNKNNDRAGTRLRKGCQRGKELFQEIRVEIQDIKNKQV